MRRRRRALRVLVLVAGLAIALLLAEVAVRAIRPVDSGSSYEFRVPHSVLGWVLQPDASYRNRMADGDSFVSYNSRGWRDVEHTEEKPAGRFRVVVLGDSFLEAYSVDLDQSFHRRLERRLRAAALDAETINLGVGGYGTLQEYLAYRDEGRRYSPDLVLLGFYLDNDVRNNCFELESRIETRGLKADSRPFLQPGPEEDWGIRQTDYDGARQRYAAAREARQGREQWLRQHSALLGMVTNQVESWKSRRSARRDAPANEVREPDEAGRQLARFGVHLCEEPPEVTGAWKLTERILRRLKREVDRDGARLVVFGIPAWIETDPAQIRQAEREPTTHGPVCIEEPTAHRRLAGLLARLEIDQVDLLPAFRNAAGEGRTELFRRGDRHWSPAGHALAADLVADALLTRELLSPRDAGGEASPGGGDPAGAPPP